LGPGLRRDGTNALDPGLRRDDMIQTKARHPAGFLIEAEFS